jgi:hypothetical protein
MRIGFGMWCVGLCLLFAGAAAAQGWTAYNPDGGRYRIDVPGAPKVNTAPIPVSPGQTVRMTEAEVRLGPVGYLSSWVDYPERIARAASADLTLDRVRDGSSAGNTLRGVKKLTLGRFPGRQYVVVQANGTNTALRTYWVRGRLYQLMVTGRAAIDAQPDTRCFFESFAFTPPGTTKLRRGRPRRHGLYPADQRSR